MKLKMDLKGLKMEKNNFNQYLNNLLGVEGGYVVDHRWPTNYGISQPTFDGYLLSKKMPKKSVKDLTYGEVKDFYQSEFYAKPKIDLVEPISKGAAGILFDYAVNSGSSKAISDLQSIVGSKADGVIGPKTIKAVEKYISKNGDLSLRKALLQRQAEHYDQLVLKNPEKYGRYIDGWKNRVAKTASLYATE